MTGKRTSWIALLAVLCTSVALAPLAGAIDQATFARPEAPDAPPVDHDRQSPSGAPLAYGVGAGPLVNSSHLRLGQAFPLASGYVNSLLTLPTGGFAAGTEGGEVVLLTTGLNASQRVDLGSPVNALERLPGGRIAAALDAGEIRLMSDRDLAQNGTLVHGTVAVWCLAVLPSNGTLLSGGADRVVRLWPPGSSVSSHKVGFNSSVRVLQSYDPELLAVGLYNGEVISYDTNDSSKAPLGLVPGAPRDGARGAATGTLAIVNSKGDVFGWSREGGWNRSVSSSGLYAVEHHAGWNVLAVGGTDATLRLLDRQGITVGSFNLGVTIRSMAAAPWGFVVGDSGGAVRLLRDDLPPTLVSPRTGSDGGPVRSAGPSVRLELEFDEGVTRAGRLRASNGAASHLLPTSSYPDGRLIRLEADVTGLPEGAWELRLEQVEDVAGNAASAALPGLVVDRSAPSVVTFDPTPGSALPPGARTFRAGFDEPVVPGKNATAWIEDSMGAQLRTSQLRQADQRQVALDFDLPDSLAPGPITLHLDGVADGAGNLAGSVLVPYLFDPVAPVAHAGEDLQVAAGDLATLDGSRSSGFHTAAWEVGGTVYPDIVARHAFPDRGVYTATLTVRDQAGNLDADSITITVSDVTAPTSLATPLQNPTNRSRQDLLIEARDPGGAGLRSVLLEASGPGGWSARRHLWASGPEASLLATLTLGGEGSYRVTTTAEDRDGNRQSPGQVSYFLVDRRAPVPKKVNPSVSAGEGGMQVTVEFDEPISVAVGTRVVGLAPGMRVEALRASGDRLMLTIKGQSSSPFSARIEGVEDAAGNLAQPVLIDYSGTPQLALDLLDFLMGALLAASTVSLAWAWSLRPRTRSGSDPRPGSAFGKGDRAGPAAPVGPRPPGKPRRLADSLREEERTEQTAVGVGQVSDFDEAVKRLLDPVEHD